MSSRPHNHKTHHHRQCHGMTCREFDALLDRAEHRCELCGTDPAPIVGSNGRVTTGLLIDHDHAARETRGLLCSRCNAHMRRIDSGERPTTEAELRYLSLSRRAA